jgi:putative tryptophan/tyrosine transport system substrate-binding protein
MRRREFITLLGSAAFASPNGSLAQVSSKRRLATWLSSATQKVSTPYIDEFLIGMTELGYAKDRDFNFVARFSEGVQDRLPMEAEELVQLQPDVILAAAVVGAVAARRVTKTIPIVCGALTDAVHLGLIASEARPGGNVTGIEPYYVAGLPAKQIEIAHEIVPGATRVGLLTDLVDPSAPPQVQEFDAAAKKLRLTIIMAGADRPDAVSSALQTLTDQHVDVMVVVQSSMLLAENQKIADFALDKRLPSVYGYREYLLSGGLISYGVDLRWCYHRTAYFVDKIFHGTPPGDLPVEFPTILWLSINLNTADALGLTIPPTLRAAADEVIK